MTSLYVKQLHTASIAATRLLPMHATSGWRE